MKILISSRSERVLKMLEQRISRCGGYEIECVRMVNGNMDPLRGIGSVPDVLVLHGSEFVVDELRALAERSGRERPALVVVGDSLPSDAAKYAMRAGARDFIGEHDAEELAECLRRLSPESGAGGNGKTIVVMNAKGGSGATFIATSLAQLSASASAEDTVVVDLDFQYASLPHYLDVKPKRGLLEALAHAHELDETAVSAYIVKHESGLDVLAPIPDTQTVVEFSLADRMALLLRVLKRRYGRIVIDLPRHLDDLGSQMLQDADEIIVVMQQSLLAVHDAVRLKTLLVEELAVPEQRITTVINRHSKSSALDVDSIGKALDDDNLVLIPNHYKLVAHCLDVGVAVMNQAPGSPIVKALMALQGRVIEGQTPPQARSFLAKTVMRLRG
jgi:pilus assembly protein CpaE